MRRLVLGYCLVIALILGGCANPIAGLITTRSAKEKEIATLRADYEGKLAAGRVEQDKATKVLIAAKDAQMQGAATAFYGLDSVFRTILTPTRTDLVGRNLTLEGWAALGNIPPTAEAMRAMNERLAKELDATRTSLANLQTSHTAALAQNATLAEQAKQRAADLAAAEAKVTEVRTAFAAELDKAQTALNETNGKLISAEKARSDDHAAIVAAKTKGSAALGIIGLIAIAAAVYLPVFRGQCAAFGALCLLGAGAIWFIQPWMLGAVVGAGILALVVWMALKHHKEERIGDALSLAMQDLREKGGHVAEIVESTLKDRLARYRKVGGKLVTETDHALEAHLDAKLASYDALPSSTPT